MDLTEGTVHDTEILEVQLNEENISDFFPDRREVECAQYKYEWHAYVDKFLNR